jgi:hypothetical protein
MSDKRINGYLPYAQRAGRAKRQIPSSWEKAWNQIKTRVEFHHDLNRRELDWRWEKDGTITFIIGSDVILNRMTPSRRAAFVVTLYKDLPKKAKGGRPRKSQLTNGS